MTEFTDRVVEVCESELRRWNGVGRKAGKEPFSSYVGEYWQVGLNVSRRDGQTVYVDPHGRRFRPPWSAAFVSYVYRLAGAGDSFSYHHAHIHYVIRALLDAQAGARTSFLARDAAHYQPKPGDLITEVRGARSPPLKDLLKRYGTNTPPLGNFIPTHSDIVVEVDQRRSRLRTIGGNLFEGVVAERWWSLSTGDKLEPTDQLLCIIECTL